MLRPRTLRPSLKITPAPRKPIPETTWAAIRVSPRAIRHDMGIGHENRGPERDQRIGSQARETLAPLPLEANRRAEAGGDEEIQSGLRKLHGHHGEDLHELKSHGAPRANGSRPAVPQLSDFARVYSMERGPALENAGHPGQWPRRLTDQPWPIASMTMRNSTSATATTR